MTAATSVVIGQWHVLRLSDMRCISVGITRWMTQMAVLGYGRVLGLVIVLLLVVSLLWADTRLIL